MAQEVSVIIPNFNGQKLLESNLPQVIKNCPNSEIILVDDASTDNSVSYVCKKFKKVKVYKFTKNHGFAFSANFGAKKATSSLILLLNSDVSPSPNFLKPATSLFKTTNVFAVALADESHENGKVITRGRGGAEFKKGFLNHFAGSVERGETLWVSGGSGLFDRKKFLDLGGFDLSFAPFYWEDIDLSYRARKSGFICYFEPLAKVDHFHEEGAIKKTFSSSFIKTVSYKNQIIFIWKNISDTNILINHLLWLPYHLGINIFSRNFSFIFGFAWAFLKLPSLIFNYEPAGTIYQLSDKEVLKNFAKP